MALAYESLCFTTIHGKVHFKRARNQFTRYCDPVEGPMIIEWYYALSDVRVAMMLGTVGVWANLKLGSNVWT